MNKDPYKILGISPNATDEQVKTAYRELARKYHPDNYANNPLSDLAEEKMKEINEAYDAIIKMRRSGGGYAGGSASYGGSTVNQNGGNSQYSDIRNMINTGRVLDAETLLNGIPVGSRDAEWNFLKGSVAYRKGWLEEAYRYFYTAARMDPSNMEYRSAVSRMEAQRRTGGYRTTAYGNGQQCDSCDLCTSLMCANCLCNCLRC